MTNDQAFRNGIGTAAFIVVYTMLVAFLSIGIFASTLRDEIKDFGKVEIGEHVYACSVGEPKQ